MQPNRIEPAMPSGAYKTYEIRQPHETHSRSASCEEVGCGAYIHGWVTALDINLPAHQDAALFIETQSGRSYTKERTSDTTYSYKFSPGQTCFAAHMIRIGREPIYVVKNGDWRRSDNVVQRRAADWVEDFGEHQARLSDRLQQG